MPYYEFEGKIPSVDPEAFVHPQSVLIGDVRIEAGCFIGAGAVLRGDFGSIMIQSGSNIQENCVLHTFPDKLTLVHPETHVGHSCVLHGCEVGSNVLVGMGAVVADGSKINSNCLIGAASYIPPHSEIPPFSMAVGSPAKVVRRITDDQLEEIRSGLVLYRELVRRYTVGLKEITLKAI